jgi:hypothetical protein
MLLSRLLPNADLREEVEAGEERMGAPDVSDCERTTGRVGEGSLMVARGEDDQRELDGEGESMEGEFEPEVETSEIEGKKGDGGCDLGGEGDREGLDERDSEDKDREEDRVGDRAKVESAMLLMGERATKQGRKGKKKLASRRKGGRSNSKDGLTQWTHQSRAETA